MSWNLQHSRGYELPTLGSLLRLLGIRILRAPAIGSVARGTVRARRAGNGGGRAGPRRRPPADWGPGEDGRGRGLLVFYSSSAPTTTHSSRRPRATVGLLGILRLRLVEPPTGPTRFLSLRLSPRLRERGRTRLLLPPEAFLLFTLSVQSLQI